MTINKLLDRIHILTPAQIRNLSDKAMEMITNRDVVEFIASAPEPF